MDKITAWLKTTPYYDYEIEIASADASFRKYYRLRKGEKTLILMDASLEKSSLAPFLDVTQRLLHVKVNAPQILEQNLEAGFLILTDFGTTNLLDRLDTDTFKRYYSQAIDTIVMMQEADASGLPLYDKTFLHGEMDYMKEWYIEKLLHVSLDGSQNTLIQTTLDAISEVLLQQPQGCFVHRDFHSRNIMLTPDAELGVIDYQDAMNGSITYDLVSLLKDCYIAFDRASIEKLVLEFRDQKGLHVSDATFIKWFDFMGLQRHIKVLGIFSRLYLRDGKDGYLKDIPLTLKYVLETGSRYSETEKMVELLKQITQIGSTF
jgi:hypothetical protein